MEPNDNTQPSVAMFPVKQQEDRLLKISLLDFDPELRARFMLLQARDAA